MDNERQKHIERGKLIERYANADDTPWDNNLFYATENEKYEWLGIHAANFPLLDFPIAPRDNGPPQTRISLRPKKLRRPRKPVYL